MKAAQLALTIDKVIEENATIQGLKAGQKRQGNDIHVLKDEQRRLADEQHRQGVILEDIQSQVETIAEAVTPLLRNSEEIPRLKNTLESHSQEITMTQHTLKHHIKDPDAHRVVRKS